MYGELVASSDIQSDTMSTICAAITGYSNYTCSLGMDGSDMFYPS